MAVDTAPRLTEKQRAVAALIDRRVPIKLIAAELGVSESRINQHIRALKAAYGVQSLNDLVEAHRQVVDKNGEVHSRKPASTKKHLPQSRLHPEQGGRANPGEFVFADAVHIPIDAPWRARRDPRVVPGALDGDHAVLYRLVAMVGLSVGIVATVVLVVAAALSVSEVLGGMVNVPAEQSRPA